MKNQVGVYLALGFPSSSAVKNLPANARDTGDVGSIPRLRRSPREGNGNALQYSCWEIQWTEEPGGYSPWGCKEPDMTQGLNNNYLHSTFDIFVLLLPGSVNICCFGTDVGHPLRGECIGYLLQLLLFLNNSDPNRREVVLDISQGFSY